MNAWDFVKKIGVGLVAGNPAGAAVLGIINGFLPDDKKLSDKATGEQAEAAIEGLSGQDRAALMSKKIDLQMTEVKESNETVRAMLEHDNLNPQSTRPAIAIGCFRVVAACSLMIIAVWCVGVLKSDAAIVKAAQEGALFVTAVNAPLVTVLLVYFGVIRKEHKQRMDAANGATAPGGIMGALASLLSNK